MSITRLTMGLLSVSLTILAGTAAYAKPAADDLRKVASCIAKKNPAGARALVLSVPGSADEANQLTALSSVLSACGASSSIEGDPSNKSLMIGALATPISTTWSEISGRWIGVPDRDERARSSAALTAAYPKNAAVARCLFITYPDEGEDYVRAKPGTKREASALAFLLSEISRCVDTGETIEMTLPLFKAEMVRAYVRYVCAPNDPTPLAVSSLGGQYRA